VLLAVALLAVVAWWYHQVVHQTLNTWETAVVVLALALVVAGAQTVFRVLRRSSNPGGHPKDLAKFVERGIDVSEAAWNCGLSLGAQRPPGCRSVVYPGRRLKRPSHRPLISLQVDVVGHVLVNGLDDRRRRILADGIQDVSERLGQGLGTGRRALEQASG
jgi:hypothetical protein